MPFTPLEVPLKPLFAVRLPTYLRDQSIFLAAVNLEANTDAEWQDPVLFCSPWPKNNKIPSLESSQIA